MVGPTQINQHEVLARSLSLLDSFQQLGPGDGWWVWIGGRGVGGVPWWGRGRLVLVGRCGAHGEILMMLDAVNPSTWSPLGQ